MKTGALLWEGSFFVHHSLANVNCEIVAALISRGIRIGLIPFEPHQFDARQHPRFRPISTRLGSKPPDVVMHVRHRWPPDFTRPNQGAFILIQPWEFSRLPAAWIESIKQNVDEAWVHSRYVRDAYIRSGVPRRKLRVIPLGVNPDLFNPSVPPSLNITGRAASPFRDARPRDFKFLFVGGSLLRKGFDVLLRAYSQEFSADENVCLIIKDFFYGHEGAESVRMAQRKRKAPRILYWYGTMPAHRLGGLYRACNAYVHPFRGEGTALPILEAMACGLPVVVTNYGPAREICGKSVSYLIPAREEAIPDRLWYPRFPTRYAPRWAQPDAKVLRRLMRFVFEERDAAHEVGRRASQHVLRRYTWDVAAQAIIKRVQAFTEHAKTVV